MVIILPTKKAVVHDENASLVMAKAIENDAIARVKEADVRLEEIKSETETAKLSIEAQKSSDNNQREAFTHAYSLKSKIIGGTVAGIFIIIIVAMFTDNQPIAMDIIKVLAGVAGGYGLGVVNRNQ